MTSSNIVSLAVTALNLVPVAIYFATRRRQEPVMRFFAIMLIAHFISDLVGTTTWILGDAKTAYVLNNIYCLIETIMLLLLFRVKLDEERGRGLLVLGA